MIPPAPVLPATPDPIDEILRRIARVESGGQGDYAARGPLITQGAYRGQRAAGKYQIMPGNLPAWSREALGREVSLEEFLAQPELQEQIARHRVSAYYDQYGNIADVASVWHSGRPLREAGGARDQNMTTREYVGRVTGTPQEPDPALEARIAAGRELRRRGALSAEQDAALTELERRTSSVDALARFRLETGGTAGAEGDTENTVQLYGTYDADSAAGTREASTGPIGQARAKWERGEALSPGEAETLGFGSPDEARREWESEQARARGRESVRPEDRDGFNAAAVAQGFGSGLFGVGTPLSALGELVESRLDDEAGESSWGESLQFARGRRDQLRESHPQEFYGGMAGSLLSGIGAARGLSAAARAGAPRAASVFTLQAGQTARNLARLSATGAIAGGVTAANEEGLDAAAGGAALGAVAGPALAGVVRAGVGGARAVASRVRPDNAAIRLLAQRLGEPVSALQQRYDDFVEVRGRPPRLVEIMRRETAEEMGQISRARSEAGAVFRQAEEDAARALPDELAPLVRDGGAVGSEPAAAVQRAATTREAAAVVGRRVQSTEPAQLGRRDVAMDRVMRRIGAHRVPITDEMLEVVQHPDVWNSLDPAVRRGLGAAIDAAGEGGTPYLTVARWDMIRQDLAKRGAGPGAGTIYARLRDSVRDYVSGAVPEYGAALREYGRRSDVARGTVEGQRVLTRATREFADRLRTAGGVAPGPQGRGMAVPARDLPPYTAPSNLRETVRSADWGEWAGRAYPQARPLPIASRSNVNSSELRSLPVGVPRSGRPGYSLEPLSELGPGRFAVVYRDETGHTLGALRFDVDPLGTPIHDDAWGSLPEVFVDASVRRQGIATRLYEIARNAGFDLSQASGRVLTPDGYAFHAARSTGVARSGVQTSARRVPELAGMRVGARTTLANVLSGEPAKAERLMARLARDAGMRERVRLALRPDEAAELERLAARYGQQLDFSAGLRTGRSVLQQSDTEAFQEAVAQASRPARAGVRQGARAALSEAAAESPGTAARTAQRMAEDPGLQTRIATALGSDEARRLSTLGRSVTESERRLAEAAPGGVSLAATRARENAEGIQRVIQAGAIASRHVGGGFLSNFTNAIVQRTRLSKAAARRLAEMAADPRNAHVVIARLRRAGVEADEILRMYQEAAAAAGIQAGRGGDTLEPSEQ